ncbi:MAG: DbpA RNA binding domain-containing protein, partial [Longimicrobiales bacterium]
RGAGTPVAQPAAAPSRRGSLAYIVVAERDKPDALAELIGRPGESTRVVITRTSARAAALRDQLERRGFSVTDTALAGAPGDAETIAVIGALDAPRATFAYDVPADPRVLERLEPETGIVLVTARELQHLHALAAESGFELKAIEGRPRRGDVAAFRERVRRALETEDIGAQLLLLEPLFDEFSAAEVAAALSAILRVRAPARELPARGAASAEPVEAPAEPSRPAPFVRLFVSVGQKDGLRPSDIVGAFTGEAKIDGSQIGRIEIRDTFTVVEIESGTAERVIRALNGTTMRGRSVRVDYDRKTTTAPRRAHRPRA